ncbi:MAG TPA: group II intron reverse transcriptase/maturase [Planctomycetota bacterium]|nr:group II intron reverse transcriptase/maturase [Planctomycetota bacterium]
MLTALDVGVKGGKWFSLVDKVYAPANLRAAFARVKANRGSAGVDHVTVKEFEAHLEENLDRLHRALRAGTCRPQAIRRAWIPKPGSAEQRPLGIPTVRDRVVQSALRNVLQPIFERDFAEHSYGFRPGRGTKDALRRVDGLLKRGYTWVVDADLKSYFDSIPRDRLMEQVRTKVADGRVLALVAAYLEQGVMDGLASWTPERGTPQGAVISPLLSNLYLDPLDHSMAERGFEMTRYADDFVVQCRSEAEAREALAAVEAWTAHAGLLLHPDKTRVVDATRKGGGFEFLGYHFEVGKRWPRKKSLAKLKDTLRAKTRRANGRSLAQTLTEVNRTLRGWFEHFKHSHWTWLRDLDKWLRMRLRGILRKRSGRRGRERGTDHQRWPNAFFDAQGLFSTLAAQRALRQPSRR